MSDAPAAQTVKGSSRQSPEAGKRLWDRGDDGRIAALTMSERQRETVS